MSAPPGTPGASGGEAGHRAQRGPTEHGPAEVLAPLAARYPHWPRLPAALTSDTRDEDPALVRAMPVVLRMERGPAERELGDRHGAPPAARTPLLEAAASAVVAVCLDERAAPGGEWHDAVAGWVAGRIRKVARRARGAHWAAVQELPGVTVVVDGDADRADSDRAPTSRAAPAGRGEARALLPGLVAETPREVSRLQIAGTDLPADSPGPVPAGLPVIWLNPEPELSVGKAAAQVGHASMLLAAALPGGELARWRSAGLRCAVRVATRGRWRAVLADAATGSRSTVLVRDAGFTEVAPGTVTCGAQWPN